MSMFAHQGRAHRDPQHFSGPIYFICVWDIGISMDVWVFSLTNVQSDIFSYGIVIHILFWLISPLWFSFKYFYFNTMMNAKNCVPQTQGWNINKDSL